MTSHYSQYLSDNDEKLHGYVSESQDGAVSSHQSELTTRIAHLETQMDSIKLLQAAFVRLEEKYQM